MHPDPGLCREKDHGLSKKSRRVYCFEGADERGGRGEFKALGVGVLNFFTTILGPITVGSGLHRRISEGTRVRDFFNNVSELDNPRAAAATGVSRRESPSGEPLSSGAFYRE